MSEIKFTIDDFSDQEWDIIEKFIDLPVHYDMTLEGLKKVLKYQENRLMTLKEHLQTLEKFEQSNQYLSVITAQNHILSFKNRRMNQDRQNENDLNLVIADDSNLVKIIPDFISNYQQLIKDEEHKLDTLSKIYKAFKIKFLDCEEKPTTPRYHLTASPVRRTSSTSLQNLISPRKINEGRPKKELTKARSISNKKRNKKNLSKSSDYLLFDFLLIFY